MWDAGRVRRRELTLTPVGGAAEPCAARVRLFAGLDRAQLERISALARPRELEPGELLHVAGARTGRLSVVHSGGLALSTASPTGQERVVRMAEAGDSLGEQELLTGAPSPYAARAVAPTRLCTFSHDEVQELFARHPGIARRVMRTLAVRLAEADRRLAQERLSVPARLAGHLLELPAVHGEAGPAVALTAPKKDVASLLGTTPEAFSRALRRLADDGVIAVDGPRVELRDPEALERLAGG